MNLRITRLVFKNNGQPLCVVPHTLKDHASADAVARQSAAARFQFLHEGRAYVIEAEVRLALIINSLSKGSITVLTELANVKIPPKIPKEVLEFDEIEYDINYSYKPSEAKPVKSQKGKSK